MHVKERTTESVNGFVTDVAFSAWLELSIQRLSQFCHCKQHSLIIMPLIEWNPIIKWFTATLQPSNSNWLPFKLFACDKSRMHFSSRAQTHSMCFFSVWFGSSFLSKSPDKSFHEAYFLMTMQFSMWWHFRQQQKQMQRAFVNAQWKKKIE